MQRTTGKTPKELAEAPPCPDDLLHVWLWLCQLPMPLTYSEIKAWAELTGNKPTADECELMITATNLYQKESQ